MKTNEFCKQALEQLKSVYEKACQLVDDSKKELRELDSKIAMSKELEMLSNVFKLKAGIAEMKRFVEDATSKATTPASTGSGYHTLSTSSAAAYGAPTEQQKA